MLVRFDIFQGLTYISYLARDGDGRWVGYGYIISSSRCYSRTSIWAKQYIVLFLRHWIEPSPFLAGVDRDGPVDPAAMIGIGISVDLDAGLVFRTL